MVLKNTIVALGIFTTFLCYANTTEQEKNPSNNVQHSPQTIQATNNAPFLKQGETVVIIGDSNKHNYVNDMEQMEKESLFQEHAILFVGGFLLFSIFICSFIYFHVSRKHKNEEGTIKD